MLSVRGQIDLEHYETRLRLVLGSGGYRTALELLTEAAVGGGAISDEKVLLYRQREKTVETGAREQSAPVEDVLRVLEHDGYLERQVGGYRFLSGLLEDWWRGRHGQYFVPIA